jgi:hypothetical protein
VFPEEEGSRFGIACLGSRLLAGDLDPARAAGLRDADGIHFAEAAAQHGLDPAHLGRDEEALRRIGMFVELHVEQGRGLIELGQPDRTIRRPAAGPAQRCLAHRAAAATGVGHDAGVLATEVPTGMVFVRNPTGVSHSPSEHVEDADADSGADALAAVLGALLGRPV